MKNRCRLGLTSASAAPWRPLQYYSSSCRARTRFLGVGSANACAGAESEVTCRRQAEHRVPAVKIQTDEENFLFLAVKLKFCQNSNLFYC